MSFLTSLLFLAAAAPAQDLSSHQATLDLRSPFEGTTFTATLRSTEIGQPSAIALGRAGLQVFPQPDALVTVAPFRNQLHFGVIGADGEQVHAEFLAPGTVPAGLLVYGQGLVRARDGRLVASEREAVVIGGLGQPIFQNYTGGLPSTSNLSPGLDIDAADFDRDGDLDLILGNSDKVRLYVNHGATLADESDLRIPLGSNQGARDLELADVDLDGDLDLVAVGVRDAHTTSPLPNRLWINDGHGNFSDDASFPPDPPFATAAGFGDVDGDGDLDLIIVNSDDNQSATPEPSALLINQGGIQGGVLGTFAHDAAFAAAAWNDPLLRSEGLALGDVDRDGDLDVAIGRTDPNPVTGHFPGEPNVLLLNDGNGQFTDASDTHLPVINFGEGDNTNGVTFADLDGDGYLDLVVSNSHLSVQAADSGDVLLNRGAADPGKFDNSPSTLPGLDAVDLSIVLGTTAKDVDLDGDTDVLLTPHEWLDFGSFPPEVGQPALFLNQGGAQGGVEGTFLRDLGFFAGLGTFICPDAVLADLDGDGDPDLYAPSQGGITNQGKVQDYLLRNLIR